MSTVLVTGAGGFIGRHCLPLLARTGFGVEAVYAEAPVLPDAGAARWHQADLLDAAQARALIRRLRPTHLLHLAWYAVPGRFWTAPENAAWLSASETLFEDFFAQGGTRVVAAGSCAEYDWHHGDSGGVCSETDTPLAPATPYGAAKHELQRKLAALSAGPGLSSAWGRIFLLYGPHEHPARLVPSVIRALLAGEPARCTRGDQVRDFLHVADAADALVSLLASTVTGAVNIGSGTGVPVREVVERIAARMQAPHLLRMGALPTPAGEPPTLVAGTARLRGELGWKAAIPLDAGLDRTIAWWKSTIRSPAEQR
jgi:nucleoside-diphosphate-sugar epimerase